MQRRRLSSLGKMMLYAASHCLPEEKLKNISVIFASRHGESRLTRQLLTDLAKKKALSPNEFSHSVHNAVAGVFSIIHQNPQSSLSMAAGEATFDKALLEAVTALHSDNSPELLLIVGEEPLPKEFSASIPDHPSAHVSAWHLTQGLEFHLQPLDQAVAAQNDLAFLAWHQDLSNNNPFLSSQLCISKS